MYTSSDRVVVAKFGGTSVVKYADKIREITDATDATRKFLVVSAPGKKTAEDTKLTDILFTIADTTDNHNEAIKQILEKCKMIGIEFDEARISEVISEYLQSKEVLTPNQYRAHIASLGEHLSALLYADYLGATYLDPKTFFVLDVVEDHSKAKLNFAATVLKWKELAPQLTDERYIIPGYYGACPEGNTALFSRGGSDLTGAYLAYLTDADIYENFTDSPILAADPNVIADAHQLETVTFKELRDLTYSGFNILHQDVVNPLAEKEIPIEIRGTAEFPKRGTIVTLERTIRESIIGVAYSSGFVPINIYMPGLHEIDFALADILNILRELNLPVEHVSTGIDDDSIIIRQELMQSDSLDNIRTKLIERFGNKIEVTTHEDLDLGLLTVVGEGMHRNVGISGQIQKTLADAGVNIYAIDQSITERNIVYCIKNNQSEAAITAIYDAFMS